VEVGLLEAAQYVPGRRRGSRRAPGASSRRRRVPACTCMRSLSSWLESYTTYVKFEKCMGKEMGRGAFLRHHTNKQQAGRGLGPLTCASMTTRGYERISCLSFGPASCIVTARSRRALLCRVGQRAGVPMFGAGTDRLITAASPSFSFLLQRIIKRVKPAGSGTKSLTFNWA
jgi:hypothetical protein